MSGGGDVDHQWSSIWNLFCLAALAARHKVQGTRRKVEDAWHDIEQKMISCLESCTSINDYEPQHSVMTFRCLEPYALRLVPQLRYWRLNMDIKVLGPGCPKCHTLEKNTKEAVRELGLEAEVSKVTDVNEIAGYGVFITPGLVVDGEVKLTGKVATKNEIKKLLSE